MLRFDQMTAVAFSDILGVDLGFGGCGLGLALALGAVAFTDTHTPTAHTRGFKVVLNRVGDTYYMEMAGQISGLDNDRAGYKAVVPRRLVVRHPTSKKLAPAFTKASLHHLLLGHSA